MGRITPLPDIIAFTAITYVARPRRVEPSRSRRGRRDGGRRAGRCLGRRALISGRRRPSGVSLVSTCRGGGWKLACRRRRRWDDWLLVRRVRGRRSLVNCARLLVDHRLLVCRRWLNVRRRRLNVYRCWLHIHRRIIVSVVRVWAIVGVGSVVRNAKSQSDPNSHAAAGRHGGKRDGQKAKEYDGQKRLFADH
jgi:hypothetical protein